VLYTVQVKSRGILSLLPVTLWERSVNNYLAGKKQFVKRENKRPAWGRSWLRFGGPRPLIESNEKTKAFLEH
jgi:hypothetical protein